MGGLDLAGSQRARALRDVGRACSPRGSGETVTIEHERMLTEAVAIASTTGVERDPNEDIMSWLARGVASLNYSLDRARELRDQSTCIAVDRTRERDDARSERDACARELARVLRERDDDSETRNLARRALDMFGIDAQLGQAAEEVAELFIEISHHRRGRGSMYDVAAEIVDVEFMCAQLRLWIGTTNMSAAQTEKMAKVRSMLEREEMSR